jgi:hypothetical protein
MVSALRDIMTVLDKADLADKTEIYGQLGVRLMYQPEEKKSDRLGQAAGFHVRKNVSEGTRTAGQCPRIS